MVMSYTGTFDVKGRHDKGGIVYDVTISGIGPGNLTEHYTGLSRKDLLHEARIHGGFRLAYSGNVRNVLEELRKAFHIKT